ncbi:Hypothetical predicted protein [Mytilus galloprovincialis]|uniref:SUEL-type lectin domain-containing protein n=1 Tax=Mytilus galloprovincialis TaxID=29158 RepID=A0A8B6GNZ4_MYTGA|nr:Hypothetical predicted protein [Mytilus galloprovincialis]
MEKFTDQIALLIGLVFCLNGYSFYGEKCYSIKNNTTGTLQCPDGKSIVIKQIGFANKNCSSDDFLNPRHLSLLTNIKCTNMSTCRLPFQHHLYNFLNIGFQCKECVFTGENNFLKCRFNHKIKIDNVLVLNNTCPAYDIFKVKNIQRNDIKSKISEECSGNQTCEIIKDYPNNTSIYFHCEEEPAVNDTDRRHNGSSKGHLNTNHTSNPDNRNQTSEYSNGNQNHTLIDLKSNQTNSLDHENGILNHTPEQPSGYQNHTTDHGTRSQTHTTDDHKSPNHINKRSNEKTIGGAIAGGVSGILIAFLLIGVFLIRRCRNKNAHESNANEINKTRSNLMYDPSEIQVDQEINNQRTYSENLPQKSSVYSMDTNYDHLQSKESNGNNYKNGKDTNYIHKRDSSTYDHIQSKDGMRNQQTKTLDTDVYSHLKGGAAVSDAIYDHTLRNGIRDNFEGDYDVSRGIMTGDDYDVSGNFNQSQVKNSDSLYN